MALIGSLMTGFAVAGPLPGGPAQLYVVPGTYQVIDEAGAMSLDIRDGQQRPVARSPLMDCNLDPGYAGVFPLIFPGSAEPMVGVHCAPAAGEAWRFLIFAPHRDASDPVVEFISVDPLGFRLHAEWLEIWRGAELRIERLAWDPGFAPDRAALAQARSDAAVAGGPVPSTGPVDSALATLSTLLADIALRRDTEALVAMTSPHVKLSFGGMGGTAMFREMISEPWFWPEFTRLLPGGPAVFDEGGAGRLAIYPAAFHHWPGELDPYVHLYADAPDAVLYTAPSVHAPQVILFEGITGRVLSPAAPLPGRDRFEAEGWLALCLGPTTCGFARTEHVRSPIDWRALFRQSGPGAPWVLETYVAGD